MRSGLLVGMMLVTLVSVWGLEPTRSINAHTDLATSVAFSPDGKTLASGGGQTLTYRPGELAIWNVENGELVRKIDGHDSLVWSVAYSPDGATIATGQYNKTASFGMRRVVRRRGRWPVTRIG